MTAIQALKEKVTALAEKLGLTAEAVDIIPTPDAVAAPVAEVPVKADDSAVDGDKDHGTEVKEEEPKEEPAKEDEEKPEENKEPEAPSTDAIVAELTSRVEAFEAKFEEAIKAAYADLDAQFEERVAKAAAEKVARACATPLAVAPGSKEESGEVSKPKLSGRAAVVAAFEAKMAARG